MISQPVSKQMSIVSVDLVFCVVSILAVMQLTDLIFSPEWWLVGLKIVLPPQQVKEPANGENAKKSNPDLSPSRDSKKTKTEFYFRFEKIRYGLLNTLYFYKEYDNLVSMAFITAVNVVFSMFYEHYTGRDSVYALCCELAFIALCCYQIIIVGIRNSTEGVLAFWFSIVSFLSSLTFMQENSLLVFNIDNAYNSLKVFLDEKFFEPNLWNARLPSDPLMFKFLLSLCCALLSYVTFNSVIKTVRCHWFFRTDIMIQQAKEKSRMLTIGSYFNFILPIVSVLLFVRPIVSLLPSESVAHTLQIWSVSLTALLRMIFVRSYLQSYLLSVLTLGLESPYVRAREKGSARLEYLSQYLLNNLKYVMVTVIQIIVLPMIMLIFIVILHNRGRDYMYITTLLETFNIPIFEPLRSVLYFNLWTTLERTHLQNFVAELLTFLSFWACLAITVLNGLVLLYYDMMERSNRKEHEQKYADRKKRDIST